VAQKRAHWLTQSLIHNRSFNYNEKDFFLRFKLNSNPNRFWEFSQLGIPVVADMYPSACLTIKPGESGFLAYSSIGWYNSLMKLIENPDLRNNCAENLRKYINANLSPEQNFLKLKELINNLKRNE
jgi:glycosyltransferase involved in cell wall biosynthesis